MAPIESMSGELIAWARTERRLARKSRRAAFFDDAVAGDGLVQDVLDFGELVLAAARGLAYAAANLARGADHNGQEDEQDPGEFAAVADDHDDGEDEGEELLQELR
jgi:hypothetical protein